MGGIPIYSGYNIEISVIQQDIVRRLYEVKDRSVGNYTPSQIPELAAPHPSNEAQNGSGGIHEPMDKFTEQTAKEQNPSASN
jgi:hypothetical protein